MLMTEDNYSMVIQENILTLRKYAEIFRGNGPGFCNLPLKDSKSVYVHIYMCGCVHTREKCWFILSSQIKKKSCVMLNS